MILGHLRVRSVLVAVACAAILVSGAFAIAPTHHKKLRAHSHPKSRSTLVGRISLQVRQIEAQAPTYRRLDMACPRVSQDEEHVELAAFLDGEVLRKAILRIRDCRDRESVEEWYFQQGKPVFILHSDYQVPADPESVAKKRLIGQCRYYLSDRRCEDCVSTAFGGRPMAVADLAKGEKRILDNLASSQRPRRNVDAKSGNLIAFWMQHYDVGEGSESPDNLEEPMIITRPYAVWLPWRDNIYICGKRFIIYDNKAKRTFATADFDAFLKELGRLPTNITIGTFDTCTVSRGIGLSASQMRRLGQVMKAGNRKWTEGDREVPQLVDSCDRSISGLRFPQ